jgi:hypothetical protein
MQKNFQNKKIDFSNIKTAIATDPDNNYAVKYEVVYVDIVDPFNSDNLDVSIENNLYYGLNPIKNPYLDVDGQQHYILNPNTFDNMESRITTGIGYSARGVIPDWMTSVQPNKTVLGFKRVVVLAYTKPGESSKIAWRIKNKNISLGVINFTADRYMLNNILSINYDITKQTFRPSRETTFDNLVLVTEEPFENVNYAVTQPFASINNRTVTNIIDMGGIDRVKGFRHGDRLIFAQQEDFTDLYALDGWVYYRDLYMGNYSDSVDISIDSYYDVYEFDSSYIVPGYTEKSSDQQTPKLSLAAATGAIILYIPYTPAGSFVNRTINANSFIDINTLILSQTAETILNGVGQAELVWKITINKPIIANASYRNTIEIYSFMTVTEVDGNTITVLNSSLPSTVAGKQRILENELTGRGIPAGTRLSRLDNNIITVEQINNLPLTINVGDYLGYHVQNQRAGIWEIEIDGTTEVVTLKFIKELYQGDIVKVLDGRSNGHSYLRYSDSIDIGKTVPRYTEVPSIITIGGNTDGRTSFDTGGTRFFDNRDEASRIESIPNSWGRNVSYPVGSMVEYDGYYYQALVNVTASLEFEPTLIRVAGSATRPRIESVQWQRFDLLTVTGDKYLKFPTIGVFN